MRMKPAGSPSPDEPRSSSQQAEKIIAMIEDRSGHLYWESFYGKQEVPQSASQFAIFVQKKLPSQSYIIDIGCGNGRDSLYFSHFRKHVIGVDASNNAIAISKQHMNNLDVYNATFLQMDIAELKQLEAFRKAHLDAFEDCIFYARFFLHSVDEHIEKMFLNYFIGAMNERSAIALEFRTVRDVKRRKIFDNHHRRFIDPIQVISLAKEIGAKLAHFEQGEHLASFGAESPHVARVILVSDDFNGDA